MGLDSDYHNTQLDGEFCHWWGSFVDLLGGDSSFGLPWLCYGVYRYIFGSDKFIY